MTDTLQAALEAYNVNVLITLANNVGLKGQGMKKGALVSVLNRRFSDLGFITKIAAGLAPVPREVITILLRNRGETRLTTIRQRLLAQKLIDPQGKGPSSNRSNIPNYRDGNSRNLDEVMAHLAACGLVFAHKLKNYYGQESMLELSLADVYFIPAEVLRVLPAPPPEPEWRPTQAQTPSLLREGSARTFQRDLYFYWSYLANNQANLTAKGLITKKSLTALNSILGVKEIILTGQVESDFTRLVFIRSLLEQLGLIQTHGDALVAQKGADFFSTQPHDRIKICLEAYIGSRLINELDWTNRIQTMGATSLFPTPNEVLNARRLIALHLKPATAWVKLSDIIGRIREQYYEFLFPRTTVNDYSYSYRNPYYATGNALGWSFQEVAGDESGWEVVEAGFIRSMITGPLYWMGLVDLGFSTQKNTEPDLVRLTSPGAWLLANAAMPEIPQGYGQVVLQPDFTLTVFDPVSDAILYQLDQFASRHSSERAIIYRLTDKSVYAGQKRGWDGQRIKAYLQELTHQTLPGNVARTLDEWQTRHERILVYPSVSLLQAASPADILALVKIDALVPWLSQPKTETVVLLPNQENSEEFPRLLVQNNWLPVITPKGGQVQAGFLTIDLEGRLTFNVKNPDLYLRGYLARFADQEGEEAYRLTPQSLRRAANSGIDAPTVVSELEKVLTGPIPVKLHQRLLAWAGHYGSASLKQTTFLVFQDESGLDDLLKDPELGPLLYPLKPEDLHKMVILRDKDLEKVRLLLEERGVELLIGPGSNR